MLDDIVGFSLYTPNERACYIPMNHTDYMTNAKVSNQLSKEFCKEQLQRLVDNNVKLIMFNSYFIIRKMAERDVRPFPNATERDAKLVRRLLLLFARSKRSSTFKKI